MKKTNTAARLELQNYFAETLSEILDDGDIAQARVAEATGIPPSHLSQMKIGRRRCTPEYDAPEYDLRLSKSYGISPGFFLRLQMSYEMERVQEEKGEQIARIKSLVA